MALDSFKIKKSINLEPGSSTLDSEGDIGYDSSTHKVKVRDNSSAKSVVTETGTATVTNKIIDAASNTISNISDVEVKANAAIALSKLAALTSHSRALVSDSSGVITEATTTSTEIGYVNGVTGAIQTQINGKISASSSDTLTNKTINATSNTISNISNTEIKSAAAIALNKLAALSSHSRALASDASGFISESAVTATELGYLSGVTSALQTQINAISGKVIQVKFGTYATATNRTSTAMADTNLTLSITPTSTSNKILVIANLPMQMTSGSSVQNYWGEFAIYRDGAASGTRIVGFRSGAVLSSAANLIAYDNVTLVGYETAPDTSAHNYVVAHASGTASGTLTSFTSNNPGFIIAMEVAP